MNNLKINNELGLIEECIRYYPPDIKKIDSDEIQAFFNDKKQISLYIHIPFCRTPCGFCPFNQYPYKKDLIVSYLQNLKKEMGFISDSINKDKIFINSIWIGGGTPMDLEIEDLEYLLNAINESFNVSETKEFTVELKPLPSHVTEAKIQLLKKAGVNRISMGVQSTDDKMLIKLNRGHTFADAYEVIENLIKENFEINIDMIYRLPDQSLEQVNNDLLNISKLNVHHVSWFPYVLHRGTPFANKVNGQSRVKNSDYYEMFCTIQQSMKEYGYSQYTPYYFTLENKCQYHVDRWKIPQVETIGMGAGAFSYYNNRIYTNAHNVNHYNSLIHSGELPIVKGKEMNYFEKISRLAVLGIKYFEIDLEEYQLLTGFNLLELYEIEIKYLSNLELISIENNKLICTNLGKAFNNDVANQFAIESLRETPQPQATTIIKEGL